MRPSLADIRDSGFLLNDSDVVLLLHRPEYYEMEGKIDFTTSHPEESEIIVAKHRNGILSFKTVNEKIQEWNEIKSSTNISISSEHARKAYRRLIFNIQ